MNILHFLDKNHFVIQKQSKQTKLHHRHHLSSVRARLAAWFSQSNTDNQITTVLSVLPSNKKIYGNEKLEAHQTLCKSHSVEWKKNGPINKSIFLYIYTLRQQPFKLVFDWAFISFQCAACHYIIPDIYTNNRMLSSN